MVLDVKIVTYLVLILFAIYFIKYYNLKNKEDTDRLTLKQKLGLEPVSKLDRTKVKKYAYELLTDMENVYKIDTNNLEVLSDKLNDYIKRILSFVTALGHIELLQYAFVITEETCLEMYTRYPEEFKILTEETYEVLKKEDFSEQDLAISFLEIAICLKGIYVSYKTYCEESNRREVSE